MAAFPHITILNVSVHKVVDVQWENVSYIYT